MATIYGTLGDDILTGTQQSDWITGSDGDDQLFGLEGNDALIGGLGDDLLDGGDGNDVVRYDGALGTVIINLQTGLASGAWGNDSLINIEHIIASNFDDTLIGDDKDNTIFGQGGNDTIFSGAGNDVIFGQDGDDIIDGGEGIDIVRYDTAPTIQTGIHLSLATGIVTGSLGNDTLVAIENIIGSHSNDTIIGDNNDNHLSGDDGDDIIYGGVGNDFLEGGRGDDRLFGEDGNDTLNALSGDTVLDGGNGNDTLYGSVGNDELYGGNGDDRLFGRTGADILDGGDGFDIANYIGSDAGIDINLINGTGRGGWAEGDTIQNIEKVHGSNHSDHLTGDNEDNQLFGNDGNDYLRGNGGADLLDGSSGIDSIVYISSQSGVTINLTTLHASGGDAEGDTFHSIERAYGSHHDDDLTGNADSNILQGYRGDDILNGEAGNDTLRGDAGADIMNGGDGEDYADYRTSVLGVTVDLATNTTSGGDAEGDTITSIENLHGSKTGDDTLLGDGQNNRLYGWGGDDILNGKAGNDTIYGGDGADIFVFDSADFGRDWIRDFEDGVDSISLVGSGLEFEDFTVTQDGNDTLLSYDTSGGLQSIRVADLDMILIDSGDFII